MRRLIGVGLVVLAGAAGSWWWWGRSESASPGSLVPGDGERITVEVLNGSGVDGLARAMTRRLRSQGIDVVYFGTAAADTVERTVVLARRRDTTGVGRVLTALGLGTLSVDEDPRLLLDASVYLGLDAARFLGHSP